MPVFDFDGDMDNIFLTSGFQESITYNGTTISAIVFRERIEQLTNPRKNLNKYKIDIMVSKTDVATINRNQDLVVLTQNGDSQTYVVNGVISEDSGAWYLGIS